MTPLSSAQKTALLIGSIFCFYLVIVGAYQWQFRQVILPGVRLDGQAVGKLNKTELKTKTSAALAALKKPDTLTLAVPNSPQTAKLSLKNSYTINEETVWQTAYSQGRSLRQVWTYAPFLMPIISPNISIAQAVDINKDRLKTDLAQAVEQAKINRHSTDAHFVYDFTNTAGTPPADVTIQEAYSGEQVNLKASFEAIVTHLRSGSSGPSTLVLDPEIPARFRAADLQPILPTVKKWVSAPISLSEADGTALSSISSVTISKWIQMNPSSTTPEIRLNPTEVKTYFASLPSTRLQAPTNGILEVDQENRLTKMQAPTRGQELNLSETLKNIQEALDGNRKAKIVIDIAYGRFEGEAADRLGIKEHLGSGHSNYSGSPSNRRKNIALGAKKVDSSLIAPNTEFSLLHALGVIDGKNGWLPELVIKGNKTVPEFGGGLCQIGTTIFRAALNAGMPITERRNHSYRVRYYEPAGTDATIYDPAPDFKFKNDSANWLLVTKDMSGDDVNFHIWGTKDGRVASSSTPIVSNIIAPPPKKIIETTDIPVGTTKCTETAHAGASASFDYDVTYANGEVKKVTFKSVYKPWQAVCLVGVSSVTTPVAPTGVDETGLNNPG